MTDVVFTVHPTPPAPALLVCSDAGLIALHLLLGADREADRERDAVLGRLAALLRTLPGRDDTIAPEARSQLDEYFAGTRTQFELDLDWRLVHGFSLDALKAACEIPYGQTAGYGEVAIMAGRPHAARAVGNACSRSPFSIVVPVHRVVRADGSIGGYGDRVPIKRMLLDHERAVSGV